MSACSVLAPPAWLAKWAQKKPSSRRDRLGKTNTARASTHGSGMNGQRRGLLHATRSSDPDRELALPLQYRQAAQFPRLPTTSAGKLHPDRPKADHALTFLSDRSMGADHLNRSRFFMRSGEGAAPGGLKPSSSGSAHARNPLQNPDRPQMTAYSPAISATTHVPFAPHRR